MVYQKDLGLKEELTDMKDMIKDLFLTTKQMQENSMIQNSQIRQAPPQMGYFPGGKVGLPSGGHTQEDYDTNGLPLRGQEYMRDMSREERANLLQFGVGGLLDKGTQERRDGRLFNL